MSVLRCYYCGRPIENENDITMKNINTGFLELSQSRQPFHKECWKERKHEILMKNLKIIGGSLLICFGIIFFVIILPYIL